MRPTKRLVVFLLSIVMCATVLALAGCQSKQKKDADFSNVSYVAELATMKCYYHNVAKFDHDADPGFWNFWRQGYKKMWFEYTGTVTLGIDASKVKVSQPDANGNVTITIPQTEILDMPDIEEETMSTPLTDLGWFTNITDDEKKQALEAAQDKMRAAAESDDGLKYQARERAKTLLSNYVENVGSAMGTTYTITWEDAE